MNKCVVCKENQGTYTTDEGDVCVKCYKKLFAYCEDCGFPVRKRTMVSDVNVPEHAGLRKIKEYHTNVKVCPACYKTRNIAKTEITGKPTVTFPVNRFWGVELETIDANPEIRKKVDKYTVWGTKFDSSIDDDFGLECISPKMKGNKGLVELKHILRLLRAEGCNVDSSCGLHVHFDASGLSWFDIIKIRTVFFNLEREMYSIMPESRRYNCTCASLIRKPRGMILKDAKKIAKRFKLNPKDLKKIFVKSMYGFKKPTSALNVVKSKYHYTRYFWANIHNYFNGIKTIEIRLHPGTLSFTKIKNWIIICNAVIEYAVKIPNPEKDRVCLEKIFRSQLPPSVAEALVIYVEKRKKRFAV